MASNFEQSAEKFEKFANAEIQQNDDLFDGILNIEENKTQEGLESGLKAQRVKLNLEGFNLGLTKGFEIGSQLSFYENFAKTWLSIPKTGISEKERKVLEQLLKLTKEFPKENTKDQDLKLSKIEGKFKQVCAMLKIKSEKSEKDSTW